jgi:hypothetical protein
MRVIVWPRSSDVVNSHSRICTRSGVSKNRGLSVLERPPEERARDGRGLGHVPPRHKENRARRAKAYTRRRVCALVGLSTEPGCLQRAWTRRDGFGSGRLATPREERGICTCRSLRPRLHDRWTWTASSMSDCLQPHRLGETTVCTATGISADGMAHGRTRRCQSHASTTGCSSHRCPQQ